MVKRSTGRWQTLHSEFSQPVHLAEFIARECTEAIRQECALPRFQPSDKVSPGVSEPDPIRGTSGLPAHQSCGCELGYQHGDVAAGDPELFAELALGTPGMVADRQQQLKLGWV